MNARYAERGDIGRIMEILDSAREFQRSIGFSQWQDGYPSVGNVESDIKAGGAMVFEENGEIVGYSFLAVGDDAYDELPDIWCYRGQYGVIHRLAFSSKVRGKGFSDKILKLIENEYLKKSIDIIRVDTGEQNVIMQKIMLKNGYEAKGLFTFKWGPRLVYEKKLEC